MLIREAETRLRVHSHAFAEHERRVW